MKLNGHITCQNCNRPIQFSLRTHDAKKVEFFTTCKRCRTRWHLSLLTETEKREEKKGKEVKEVATTTTPTKSTNNLGEASQAKREQSPERQTTPNDENNKDIDKDLLAAFEGLD